MKFPNSLAESVSATNFSDVSDTEDSDSAMVFVSNTDGSDSDMVSVSETAISASEMTVSSSLDSRGAMIGRSHPSQNRLHRLCCLPSVRKMFPNLPHGFHNPRVVFRADFQGNYRTI